MLEKYIEGMDMEKAIQMAMEKDGVENRKQATKYLQNHVPKEKYFQKKVKDALKEKYPKAFVIKIAQGMYSEAGIPDILCIIEGHYFGFEVKRPVFGKLSALQAQTIAQIRTAGGTAEVVTYPEEALKVILDWMWEN